MLKELIRYTELADLRIIQTFLNAGTNLPEAEALFSHVLNAQHIWIKRIKKEEQVYDRFQVHPIEKFSSLHQENIIQLEELASSNLDFMVHYTNSQGDVFENNASDILFHVVNHSTYHRAQIATQFRIHHIQPPVTDFIALKREKAL